VPGAVALVLPACTAVIDVDGYAFVGSEGVQQQSPVLPSERELDAGKPADKPIPSRPPEPDPVEDVGPPAPVDAGDGGPPIAMPPAEPPPAEPPTETLPRPVLVAEPEPLVQLSGSATGGEPRAANCPGGVIYGLVFQYYTSLAFNPDRLSYAWPICSGLLPSPSASNLSDGESFDANWLMSSPDDPVFAALRDNEAIDVLTCPAEQYVVGIEGTYDEPVGPSVGFRSLAIRCASLNTDAERSDVVHGSLGVVSASGIAPVAGALSFAQACPDGQAGAQLELRFGSWLDAIGLRCSPVRWPFTRGHACATAVDCQSGSCGADGLCAP
jgi:hypothetical protein